MTDTPSTLDLGPLSSVELETLRKAFIDAKAAQYLLVSETESDKGGEHRELITGTALIVASRVAIPVLAAWLLNSAPPKPRKKTIETTRPDGTKERVVIEYAKTTPVGDLVKKLMAVLAVAGS